MFKWMTLAGVALSLLTPSAAEAAPQTPGNHVTLAVNTVNGTGCPPGSTAVSPSKDNTAFTVAYSEFEVSGGSYKNCQIGVTVHVPQGWTYAVYKIDNRGYAYLDRSAHAKVLTTSYFAGESWTMKASHKFRGVYDDMWQTTDEAGVLSWAPCNVDRDLNINNTIRVRGPESSSMAMSSTDSSVATVFHLRWKSCR